MSLTRRFFLTALPAPVLLAHAAPQAVAQTTRTNLPTVEAVYDAFAKGEIATILAALSPDIEWEHDWGSEPIPLYRPRKGVEEVAGFFTELVDTLTLTRFEPQNFLEGGNQVAAVIRFSAIGKATGKIIEDLEVHLWTFGADGKANRFRHIADTRQLAEAMGI